jgi:hypothetical protein
MNSFTQHLASRQEGYLPVDCKPGKCITALQCNGSNRLYAVTAICNALLICGSGVQILPGTENPVAQRLEQQIWMHRFESCSPKMGDSSAG